MVNIKSNINFVEQLSNKFLEEEIVSNLFNRPDRFIVYLVGLE